MWFYVVAGIIIFAAAIGFADIVAYIEQKLVCTKSDRRAAVIIPLKGHVENAELILRGALTNFKYQEPDYAKIFVIDLGISEETRKICKLIESNASSVVLCKQEEMERLVQKNSEFKIQNLEY